MKLQIAKQYHSSRACSIQLEEKVIITGGRGEGGAQVTARVTVYNISGFVMDLPNLMHGRRNHGCGYFVNQDSKVVRQKC